jgi:hypothetical protein
MIPRQARLDAAKGLEPGRDRRWPHGVHGPTGESAAVPPPGRDETPPARQRSLGPSWEPRGDALPHPSGAGQQPPLRGGLLGWYGMGRTLANHPMAHARELKQADVPQMRC